MKYLVLGALGMAGHMICRYLMEKEHDVTGFCRRNVGGIKTVCGDASDTALLSSLIRDGKFDAVVNAIGVLNQFAEENKAEAVWLNSYLPHYLASITEGSKTQVIHMSTDCVFAGNTGPYREDSLRDGSTFYDRTKALGELCDDKNLTLRNSIIGPDINEHGIGLLNWFMKQKTVKGYTGAIWTGLSTLELAKVIEAASLEKAAGLYNMVPAGKISKYELLLLFNQYMRQNEVEIVPDDTVKLDKTLIRTNYAFGYQVPDYDTMIRELSDFMDTHRELYPHYYCKKTEDD